VSSAAPPGDHFQDRIVLTGAMVTVNGTTRDATTEPGEVDEALRPAAGNERSVWYEWTPPAAGGRAVVTATLNNPGGIHSLACYFAPGAGPPVMSQLLPAGASFSQGAISTNRASVALRTTTARVLLRIWSAPTEDSPEPPGSFKLEIVHIDGVIGHPGDLPASALSFTRQHSLEGYSRAITEEISIWQTPASFTTEPEENFIGGQWYPAAESRWFAWTAEKTEVFRFTMAGADFRTASILVAQERGGRLELVAPPGGTAAFAAQAGARYLVRAGLTQGYLDRTDRRFLLGGPAEPGDEPSSAVPLPVGARQQVMMAGAGPAINSPDNQPTGIPDVWFDAGSGLAGPHKVLAGGGSVEVWRTDAAGAPSCVISGSEPGGDNSFHAEPGRRYLVRIKWTDFGSRTTSSASGPANLTPPVYVVQLVPGLPPPAHDRRVNATLLEPGRPVVVHGNASHATAEEDFGACFSFAPGRTVWYAMDDPGTGEPWFTAVLAEGASRIYNVLRDEGTHLAPLSSPFHFSGQRLWFPVILSRADSRYIFLAGPAVSSADSFAHAAPVSAGPPLFLYPGAAGLEAGEPAVPSANSKTIWLSWTAAENGLVHFSTIGSTVSSEVRAYTGDAIASLTLVPDQQSYPSDKGGRIIAFQAVSRTTYRFQVAAAHSHEAGIVVARIKPGGLTSPYDVWRLNWPAWEHEPSLTDPNADPDSDGIRNLMEMAVGGTLGPTVPDLPGFPWMEKRTAPPFGWNFQWMEQTALLRGPAGCTPLFLTGETTTGLHSWTPVHPPASATTARLQRSWSMPATPENGPQRYFRLRVHP